LGIAEHGRERALRLGGSTRFDQHLTEPDARGRRLGAAQQRPELGLGLFVGGELQALIGARQTRCRGQLLRGGRRGVRATRAWLDRPSMTAR
jgi:hypothetical protein